MLLFWPSTASSQIPYAGRDERGMGKEGGSRSHNLGKYRKIKYRLTDQNLRGFLVPKCTKHGLRSGRC
jgi:hypothetical protein